MSTTKIREALTMLSDSSDADAARAANAALRETEAIEMAAKVLSQCAFHIPAANASISMRDVGAADVVIQSIAREAP